MVVTILFALLGLITATILRLFFVLQRSRPRPPAALNAKRTLGVFLGSGGHTSEALSLISALDFTRFTTRKYYVSEGDHLSISKAKAFEESKFPNSRNFECIVVPRARRVHQSIVSTPPTALRSLFACIKLMTMSPLLGASTVPDVLILNGPGTCLILCLAVYVSKFLGLSAPRLVYVESFARVRSLSLTGKLLRPLVDRFLIQWPEAAGRSKKAEYYGILV
ncbi:glycosyltransferase family 1 protein [Cylindrobasidium torrendii FP15055 ss-10]|uniref:UDP-N-acetylglucosamine transferase subunit ALG14 n=1 Tax=Cylindrobasidium torrendii FP15055 ss-10 TaxID=1314674 RepID=A0A0D7BSF3_9AGAR|nr:glycosyltransferase family 1 protein [Cylindrobasidium torrendii FP15055 ss-10]